MEPVFIPSAGSPVRHLDREMREDLASSLQRIAHRAAAYLPGDVSIEAACRDIRAHRIDPALFAVYYEFIHQVQGNAWDGAARSWRAIAAKAGETVRLEYQPFNSLDEDAERFQRLFASGGQAAKLFARPDESSWRGFVSNVDAALALLEAVSSDWRDEIDSLLTRIYAAVPPEDALWRVSGSSSFMVWGAVVLNVQRNNNPMRVLTGIVHEATHQMLFGLSRRQPLTENPPGQRYPSPLRSDPRPMDGVYHATYVSGRLCAFHTLLGRHEGLDEMERAEINERLDRQKKHFADGYAVVRREGRLSPLGRELIEAAADHVADLAP